MAYLKNYSKKITESVNTNSVMAKVISIYLADSLTYLDRASCNGPVINA